MAYFLLDTNTISTLGAEEEDGIVTQKLYRLSDADMLGVSVVSLYEEYYGLENSKDDAQKERIEKNINFISSYFAVIALDMKEMQTYAKLKVLYKNYTGISKKEAKKNDIDFLIASSTIALNATLVSADKIFQTLSQLDKRLKVENWLEY